MSDESQRRRREETRRVWLHEARTRLKTAIAEKKIRPEELTRRLAAVGYPMTIEELTRTIQNGSFGAWFFMMVIDVMDSEIFIGQKVVVGGKRDR